MHHWSIYLVLWIAKSFNSHLCVPLSWGVVIERYAEWTDLFGHKEGILKTLVPHSMPLTVFTKAVRQQNLVVHQWFTKEKVRGFLFALCLSFPTLCHYPLLTFSFSSPFLPFSWPCPHSSYPFLFSLSLAWIIFFQEPLWKWSLCILNTYNLFQLVFFLHLVMTRQVCQQTLWSMMDAKLFFPLSFLVPPNFQPL